MTKTERGTVQVAVYLQPAERQSLREVAAASGVSMSVFVARLIRKELDK
jgi:hypothetical protein